MANNNKKAVFVAFAGGSGSPLRDRLITAALVLAVVSSSISVAFVAQKNRAMFNALEGLRREEAALDAQWSRLLLERGALAAHSRVERLSKTELGMRNPAPADIVVVH